MVVHGGTGTTGTRTQAIYNPREASCVLRLSASVWTSMWRVEERVGEWFPYAGFIQYKESVSRLRVKSASLWVLVCKEWKSVGASGFGTQASYNSENAYHVPGLNLRQSRF